MSHLLGRGMDTSGSSVVMAVTSTPRLVTQDEALWALIESFHQDLRGLSYDTLLVDIGLMPEMLEPLLVEACRRLRIWRLLREDDLPQTVGQLVKVFTH